MADKSQRIEKKTRHLNFENPFPQTIVSATMEVYKTVTVQFLPTPSKCHYLFNLRDFARVIKGVLLVPSTHMKEINKLVALWVHETYRVFYDRLVDDADR